MEGINIKSGKAQKRAGCPKNTAPHPDQTDLFAPTGQHEDQEPSTVFCMGIDEAGRGPLAGDVFAAAVILDPEKPIEGLNDSKKLSEKRREALAKAIQEKALAYCITRCNPAGIDALNILEATMACMRLAYECLVTGIEEPDKHLGLSPENSMPAYLNVHGLRPLSRSQAAGLDILSIPVWIDGNRVPKGMENQARALVKGDSKVPAIMAASILAKVARDAHALALHRMFPDYGFDRHKGYGTALHYEKLAAHGPNSAHRRSFKLERN